MMRTRVQRTVVAVGVFALASVLGSPASSEATVFTGSLSVGSGGDGNLTAGGAWDDPSSTLSWTVDDTTSPGFWHYEYTLAVPHGGISHLIVEASDDDPGPAFTLASLLAVGTSPNGWTDANMVEIQTHTPGGSNPDMPGNFYGIKLNSEDDFSETTVTVRFDSDRMPVWGDFYAKDGKVGGQFATIYNDGFLTADPLDAPRNGSVLDHLLVPDSIPEPATLALLALGGLALLRRRGR